MDSSIDYDSDVNADVRLLDVTNQLLEYVGIDSKQVLSIDELIRVGSSLFVAVFESLFHIRIVGIIRSPSTHKDYAANAQLVVDALSQHIQMDLKHITGESIVSGDLQSISNLVNILFRIVNLTKSQSNLSRESEGDDVIETFLPPKSADSISTHESAFQFQYDPELGTFPGLRDDSLDNFAHKSEFYSRREMLYEMDRKLENAASRRLKLRKMKENLFAISNQRRDEKSKRVFQSRKVDDLKKRDKSHQLQKSGQEQIMLRVVYKGLLKKMHEWKVEDARDNREKLRQLKADAEVQWKSLDNLFEDRVSMLREQERSTTISCDTLIKSQRKMLADLLKSQKQQQDKLMAERLEQLETRRQRNAFFRSEAHKDLIAVLSIESWSDSLRHDPGGKKQQQQQKLHQRRPLSAPVKRYIRS
jgi:hypothetical protein